MKNICYIIEDLLPLYVDGLTSDESNQLIDDHLAHCSKCKKYLSNLEKDIVTDDRLTNGMKPSDDIVEKIVLKARNRMLALLSGAIVMAVLIGMFSEFYIFTYLAYLLLAASLLIFLWKTDGKSKKYWLSGIFMYMFSGLAGFSIGLYTLSIAFILISLALGHSIGKIKKRSDVIISIVLGVVVWAIVINIYNGFWVFYPVIFILEGLF